MQKLLLVFFIAFTELKSLLKKHLLTFYCFSSASFLKTCILKEEP